MNKNKIVLLFPDGVGIRNYLYSDVFKSLENELFLFHSFDNDTIGKIKDITGLIDELKIPQYKESLREKFLRELVCLSRLQYNVKVTGNKTILTNWKTSHNSLSKKIFYKIIEKTAPFIKKYGSIIKLEKVYQQAIRSNPFYFEVKKILEEIQPHKVFCSHQRGLQCATIFAAAKDLGIGTTTVIYSWDNLPKARMALRSNEYWVWSDYMKEEMKIYYPEIPQESVKVTGTPQFQFYEDEQNIIDRKVFFQTYDLDPNRKIICFSGDDILTSPDDPQYLDDLADELIKNNLDKKYQILLRRCPVDLSGRYDEIVEKFPNLIKKVDPLWSFNSNTHWTTVYPTFEDVKLLVSTAYYTDFVVNVGSTMAFDFSMFDKPCVFINYDQKNKANTDWSVKMIYEFQHFRSMPDKNAVYWWNKKSDLAPLIKDLEINKMDDAMKRWRNRVVGSLEVNKLQKVE